MKKNKKTIAIIVVLLIVGALAVALVFRTDREELTKEELTEDVVEVQEVDTLDVVGAGDELVDIEKDIYNLDKELETTEQLLNQLDTELENL